MQGETERGNTKEKGEEQSRCCAVLGHGDVLLGTSGAFHHIKCYQSLNLCTAFLSKQKEECPMLSVVLTIVLR